MTDTADRLLDALDRVIAEHGSSGVTLRRVGAEAGLSHTAAAHYFKDKPGLFTAYLIRAWKRMGEDVERATEHPDPRESMIAIAVAYARFSQSEPAAFSVMNRLELVHVDTHELWETRERSFLGLASIIERYQATGWASDKELLDVIATVWSFVHGFIDLWVGGLLAAPYDGNELVDTLARVVADLIDSLS